MGKLLEVRFKPCSFRFLFHTYSSTQTNCTSFRIVDGEDERPLSQTRQRMPVLKQERLPLNLVLLHRRAWWVCQLFSFLPFVLHWHILAAPDSIGLYVLGIHGLLSLVICFNKDLYSAFCSKLARSRNETSVSTSRSEDEFICSYRLSRVQYERSEHR